MGCNARKTNKQTDVCDRVLSFTDHNFINLPGSLRLVISHCNNMAVVLFLNIKLDVQFETAVLTGQWFYTNCSGLVININVCR
jgi:hypothetical protein